MSSEASNPTKINLCSAMAENLIPSEIIKLGNEISNKIKQGEKIHNLTIGDFDPKIFPIPNSLKNNIITAYNDGQTNYPAANGMLELRTVISKYIKENLNIDYSADEILISAGARPIIYSIYTTLLDPGDKVLFATPSWNNNHYCHLLAANKIELEVGPEQNFMPTAKDIEPYIKEATMIALCSPQNPTGTVFEKNALLEICHLVIEENKRRKGIQKPLYILYDQIYWQLTFGNNKHYEPVGLIPELKDYVIYVDGISKAFAATGVRVGWTFGPAHVINKMRAILSHVGAWAPKAEQVATAHFMQNKSDVKEYLDWFIPAVEKRLFGLYHGIIDLKNQNYPIDVIIPQAAIYLTVCLPWKGKKTSEFHLNSQEEVSKYLIDKCGIAIVPFKAFGSSSESPWYRISVGTLDEKNISDIVNSLKRGMDHFID